MEEMWDCVHCHKQFRIGQLVRAWNNLDFCNELCQASYMLRKGYALQRPAEEEMTSSYGYCIFKGQPMVTYRPNIFATRLNFCDTHEFFQYVREHLGTTRVIGEKIVAL